MLNIQHCIQLNYMLISTIGPKYQYQHVTHMSVHVGTGRYTPGKNWLCNDNDTETKAPRIAPYTQCMIGSESQSSSSDSRLIFKMQ